jgi:hypothetical protein
MQNAVLCCLERFCLACGLALASIVKNIMGFIATYRYKSRYFKYLIRSCWAVLIDHLIHGLINYIDTKAKCRHKKIDL